MLKKYKIICITETHLSAENIKEAEIAIPHFELLEEDRKNINFFSGSDIYVHSTLKISKFICYKKKNKKTQRHWIFIFKKKINSHMHI